ncbi:MULTISPECIES: hypothetical protein [Streptomyces]
MSPARRRTRLGLTLVGLLIAAIGAVIYIPASIDSATADQAAVNASAGDREPLLAYQGDWDDVLAHQGDYSSNDDRFQAWADKRIAEEDKKFGMVLFFLGAAITASRWAVRPEKTI